MMGFDDDSIARCLRDELVNQHDQGKLLELELIDCIINLTWLQQ
jgi:hypothetical protein